MRDLVQSAEAAISQAMIDGSLPHERLQQVLRDIDGGRYVMQLTGLRQALTHRSDGMVVDGLVSWLSEHQVDRRVPVAFLQILAIGFYRIIWRLLARLDPDITLTHIRQLSARQAAQVCYGFTFGLQPHPFPLPQPLGGRLFASIQRFMHCDGLDPNRDGNHSRFMHSPGMSAWDERQSPTGSSPHATFLREVLLDVLLPLTTASERDSVVADLLFQVDAHPHESRLLRAMSTTQARLLVRQLALTLVALHRQAAAPLSSLGSSGRDTFVACFLSPTVTVRSWLRTGRAELILPRIHETVADCRRFLRGLQATGPGPAEQNQAAVQPRAGVGMTLRSDQPDLASSA